ncbi:hypothetical protein ACXDF8_07970 [Mycolicibacterium sp. CBM1]
MVSFSRMVAIATAALIIGMAWQTLDTAQTASAAPADGTANPAPHPSGPRTIGTSVDHGSFPLVSVQDSLRSSIESAQDFLAGLEKNPHPSIADIISAAYARDRLNALRDIRNQIPEHGGLGAGARNVRGS